MNRLTALLKKLRLRQILTVFLAGLLLIVTTACSGANAQGANPKNPLLVVGQMLKVQIPKIQRYKLAVQTILIRVVEISTPIII